MIKLFNEELDKLAKLLKINKLSLNVTKTYFIIFHNRQKLIDAKINIKINNSLIDQDSLTKFLGVIINENLTWSDHINVILNKTNTNLGVICRLAKSVPKDVLQTLYITLIERYLHYCNIA